MNTIVFIINHYCEIILLYNGKIYFHARIRRNIGIGRASVAECYFIYDDCKFSYSYEACIRMFTHYIRNELKKSAKY